MEPIFWHNKWQNNDIGFHNDAVHPLLAKHWGQLNVTQPLRIFLPLCGKTLDIHWLLAQGHHVIGVELSELAIKQLFEELNLTPTIITTANFVHYQSDNIDIYVGDIFELNKNIIANIDLIYDRAALVALPIETRKRYTSHLATITEKAKQLLICFEYDQQTMQGPPFAVEQFELVENYQSYYDLKLIDGVEVEGGLKGKCPAIETVWLLQSKIT